MAPVLSAAEVVEGAMTKEEEALEIAATVARIHANVERFVAAMEAFTVAVEHAATALDRLAALMPHGADVTFTIPGPAVATDG